MRVLKWGGIVVGVVAVVALLAVGTLYIVGTLRLNRTYEFQVEEIRAPTDAGSIARGKHIVEAIGGCQECHGENLSGQVIEDDPAFARLVASNLTSGQGGIGGRYTDLDYVRAIRHGVRPNGKALILMPAEVFYHYSGTDLGALIAYLKSLPPVNNELPATAVGPVARLFLALGQLPPEIIPASVIKHTGPRPPTPSPSVTAAYGEYLGHICTACHGPGLAGGTARDPESLAPPNLTRTTGDWLETDFIRTLRTGTTPEGHQLDPEQMPWRTFGKMTDDELRAVWLFVKSKPVQ